jgi:hypothetical protein
MKQPMLTSGRLRRMQKKRTPEGVLKISCQSVWTDCLFGRCLAVSNLI